jgi:NADH:ubiquinone oxidoreductase subunit H
MATACLIAFVFVGGWLVPIEPSFFQLSTRVLILWLTTGLLDPFLSGMSDLLGEWCRPAG